MTFAAIATDWHSAGCVHAGAVCLAHRRFGQDRLLLGALIEFTTALTASGGVPVPDTETFLPRTS